MSSRPIIAPFQVITNGNMATTLTSIVSVIQNTSVISYTYSWIGASPIGIVSIQVSNDYSQDASGQPIAGATWNTLPLSNTPSTSGNSGNGAIDVDVTGFYAVRTVYTPTSGTGILNAIVTGKVQ